MEKQEYWRWQENCWQREEPVSNGAALTAGVDVGSTSTQVVVLADGDIVSYVNMRTGSDSPDSAIEAMNRALTGTGLGISNLAYSIGTGYGRVNVPFADRTVTEITCHARGARYIYGPSLRTILDMGGQDCKAIRCDDRGRVVSFMMNDKCAAGTGRGMEVIASLLSVPVGEIGPLSLSVTEEPLPVSSMCVVYAKSEVTKLLRSGWTKEMALAAYCQATARRVARLLERNGIEENFGITGGIAKHSGVVKRLETILGLHVLVPSMDTQIAGALGAALIARDTFIKKKERGSR